VDTYGENVLHVFVNALSMFYAVDGICVWTGKILLYCEKGLLLIGRLTATHRDMDMITHSRRFLVVCGRYCIFPGPFMVAFELADIHCRQYLVKRHACTNEHS
jgi:hypothetical protein